MAKVAEAASGFWGNVDPKTKKWLIIGTSTLVVGGASFYFIRKAWRKSRADKILKGAIHEGTLARIVSKIDDAIDGWGTNENELYEAFDDIPTQNAADRVATLYYQAYGETLEDALTGDVEGEERQTINNIVACKPKRPGGQTSYLLDDWQRRLKSAKGDWSTDEDAIYRVLWEVPDKKGYALLSQAISTNKEIGYKGLPEYLIAQLDEGDERDKARYIMARKK